MKWPGISLRTMMFAVAILAANFGFFSNLDSLAEVLDSQMADVVGVILIGLLPMANLIALGLPRLLWLGLPRLLRRVRRTPFSIGFQVTSWGSTLAVLAVCMLDFEAVDRALVYVWPDLFICHLRARYIGPPIEVPPMGFFESCYKAFTNSDLFEGWAEPIVIMIFLSLPPLLVSVAGGLITRFVVRRRAQTKSA